MRNGDGAIVTRTQGYIFDLGCSRGFKFGRRDRENQIGFELEKFACEFTRINANQVCLFCHPKFAGLKKRQKIFVKICANERANFSSSKCLNTY